MGVTAPDDACAHPGLTRLVGEDDSPANPRGDRVYAPYGLQLGLLDEVVIHLAPVLLGGGIRLYGGEGDRRVELERISLGEADQ